MDIRETVKRGIKMVSANILENLQYNETKPAIKVLFETESTKEVRILMKAGQVMAEHQTPYPITVAMIAGTLDFGVEGTIHSLVGGDMLNLPGAVPHDLKATSDSIVRLTLSKSDSIARVEGVINTSK